MTAPEASPRQFLALGPAGRVWLLNTSLALAAVGALYLSWSASAPLANAGLPATVALTLAFAAAEVWVVHVQFRRETHTISLSEIPVTVGLFFLSPPLLLAAQFVGAGSALVLHRRQGLLKLAFNLLQLTLCTAVAALVFHAGITKGDPLGPRNWLVAVVATTTSSVLGALTVTAAIGLSEGRISLRKLVPITAFSLAGSVVNTSLALVGVVTIYRDPRSAALLVMPAVALYLAYLAYTRERQKTERIEFLYNSGRTLSATGGEPAIVQLLTDALDMFRAEIAQVAVWGGEGGAGHSRTTVNVEGAVTIDNELDESPGEALHEEIMSSDRGAVVNGPGGSPAAAAFLADRGLRDLVITSLRADNRVIGTILVGNRLGGITGFNLEHLNLLETLAAQVGAAVENTRLEGVLQHQAFHDSLTNLANRALLHQRIDAALAKPAPRVAVLMVDVDEFKVVNDTLGHAVGDQLLVETAGRLAVAVRGSDTAARIGGDEFAVLVEDINSQADATASAHRVIDAFRQPFKLAGQSVRVTASVGIATNLDGLLDPGTLLLQADVAMYAAKASAPGSFRVFEASMQDEVAERHALREDLRLALERGELVNYYQPLVPLDGPGVLGAEALVRWRHPDRGLIAPGYFIRIAEESGLIVQLGRWVLREACVQLREWQRSYPSSSPLKVSVNLSAVQLREPGFVDDVVGILKETGLDPNCLTLEITESTFMDDTRTAIARLRELRGLGIRLELDDFGTGFSSLSILRDLPLDGLKIDKSFVDVIHGASDRPAFLQAIVRLAEALDLEMVGEGIEHQHQADALRAMGCGRGQGYLFSRPLPPGDMAQFLASSMAWADQEGPVVAMPTRRRSD
ncbi:MAG: hypothetical protein QOK05_1290 [Chloroflexota bacterium]|jgi:diguanylate cyclase (GGDEF)-like protein|nr:hypothetical protein [Chloroflexota bacterium]